MRIDQKQIPPEVVEKVRLLVIEMGFLGLPIRDFEAREIVAAVLAAWPGASMKTTFWPNDEGVWIVPRHGWLLPIPQEARDE